MKLLLIISVMLSALVTDLESTQNWQKRHKLPGKSKSGHKGCNCLNEGTCISYTLFSQINRCWCPEGYSGDYCEIEKDSKCYTEKGEDYRGTVAKSDNNEECLSWDSALLYRWPYHAGMKDALRHGLGKHNYCRNPNGSSRPWCYVRRGYRSIQKLCDIQMCRREIEPTCGQRTFNKYFKIVNGYTAAIESQPWIATIFQYNQNMNREKFFCGGSLIEPCWVLTAAHCFQDKSIVPYSQYTVILGKSRLDTTDNKEQTFQVESIILHEGYSDETCGHNNDIALIKIRSSSGHCAVESDYVKTICLPPNNLVLRDNSQCEVSGYGKEDHTDFQYAHRLKSTNVNIISQSLCQDEYYNANQVNDNMICAGDTQWNTDACSVSVL
uniref:Urokinase-type plasminogen activator n=1 Tax=Sphenodon punctatus TaxID=8508 RepID=A0A8D0HCA1_SPHPU